MNMKLYTIKIFTVKQYYIFTNSNTTPENIVHISVFHLVSFLSYTKGNFAKCSSSATVEIYSDNFVFEISEYDILTYTMYLCMKHFKFL